MEDWNSLESPENSVDDNTKEYLEYLDRLASEIQQDIESRELTFSN